MTGLGTKTLSMGAGRTVGSMVYCLGLCPLERFVAGDILLVVCSGDERV